MFTDPDGHVCVVRTSIGFDFVLRGAPQSTYAPLLEAAQPYKHAVGASVLVPSVTDALLMTCVMGGLAAARSRTSSGSPTPSMILRSAGDRVDWERFVRLGLERGQTLRLREALPYCRLVPGAVVPRRVTRQLAANGSHGGTRSFTPARAARSGARGTAAPRRRASGRDVGALALRNPPHVPGAPPLKLGALGLPTAPDGGGPAGQPAWSGTEATARHEHGTRRPPTFDDGPSEWTEPIPSRSWRGTTRTRPSSSSAASPGSGPTSCAAWSRQDTRSAITRGHPALASDPATDRVREELERTNDELALILGETPRRFRAPHYDVDARVEAIGAELGLVDTRGDVTPPDWHEKATPALITTFVLRQVGDGGATASHDGIPPTCAPAPGVTRRGTVDAVAAIVPRLAERGIRCVTASELLDGGPA